MINTFKATLTFFGVISMLLAAFIMFFLILYVGYIALVLAGIVTAILIIKTLFDDMGEGKL